MESHDKSLIRDLFRALIERGASVNARDLRTGESILHATCRLNNSVTVCAILSTTEGRRLTNRADRRLNRPIHLATAARNHDAIAELFRSGADLNPINSDGLSPLHIAALANDVDTAASLLEYGANPNLRTDQGRTIQHCLPNDADTRSFVGLLEREKVRRSRPSIFSSNHPLATLAISPTVRDGFFPTKITSEKAR